MLGLRIATGSEQSAATFRVNASADWDSRDATSPTGHKCPQTDLDRRGSIARAEAENLRSVLPRKLAAQTKKRVGRNSAHQGANLIQRR